MFVDPYQKYNIMRRMKKDISAVVAEAVREEIFSFVRLGIKYIIFIVLFVFLILNIRLSETINPLYDQFITENINASADLTKKVRFLPEGKEIRAMQSEIYGNGFDILLAKDESVIQQKINTYENLLSNNPQARDVLYNLYLLYKYEADPRAADYLKRAQAVDPSIQ